MDRGDKLDCVWPGAKKQIGMRFFDFADIISQHIHGALSSVTQGLLMTQENPSLAQKIIGVVS